jgi:hypothetical protein
VSRTTRLTTPVDELGDALTLDDADGLGEGATLPDALPLGVGSTVGPGDEDAVDGGRPTVGAAVTRTTRGVGVPPTPTLPGCDGEELAPGEPDADGSGEAGTVVIVTVGTGGDATGSSGMNSITTASSAKPTMPTVDR